ncbi:hypothetical protein LCM4573_12145 [Rhizobium sp. LCM 4573]|nr:hypothetical protein LCM4573_12145 [Rhizobium sp. LCM 4573]
MVTSIQIAHSKPIRLSPYMLDANRPISLRSETLFQSGTSWDGTVCNSYPDGMPELSLLKITVPPNTELPWHDHPMPCAAYVLEGEITIEKPTGEKKMFGKGQGFLEVVETVHRGVTGAMPVELIVFYAGAKDMALVRARTIEPDAVSS